MDAKVDGRCGALIQVGCETDFVARTADFTGFVAALLQQAFNEKVGSAEQMLARPFGAGGASVQDVLTEKIAKLGENMQIARVAFFEAPRGAVHAYIHPGNRVGVLLEVQGDDADAGRARADDPRRRDAGRGRLAVLRAPRGSATRRSSRRSARSRASSSRSRASRRR